MVNTVRYVPIFVFCITLLTGGCSKKEEEPTTGLLRVTVTDTNTGNVLDGSRVLLFASQTNSPLGDALTSDTNGIASANLDPGSYYIKVSKQSYNPSPAKDVAAIPFSIVLGETTNISVELTSMTESNLGYISGSVAENGAPVPGVLVVAANSGQTAGYSSISDGNGNYVIYNVPVDSYNVKAWISGYNSDEQPASVVLDTETSGINLSLTAGATGSVSGKVSFLATENGEVNVALVHPLTLDTISGLNTTTVAQLYSIENVPTGTFVARASYDNDGYVLDPDSIVKFGEPTVDVADTAVDLPFNVTNAVTLSAPTNAATETTPAAVDSLTPTFSWVAYSSTSDYVIEVSDTNGNVLWGGFSNSGTTKNVVIASSQTSVVYNSDASGTALQEGVTYRWRVFASKDDNKAANGWTLISSSEEQMGLFTVVLPTQ